jgi:FAD/FMN-containing dehydrogenase
VTECFSTTLARQGDGSQITVEPGLIGGEVNRILEAHKKKGGHDIQYKIGPDPSSIDSCMIGGIVANNSSGMCCGVSQNTYHTLKDARIVFVDGTVLDTADVNSREAFRKVQLLPFTLNSPLNPKENVVTGHCEDHFRGEGGV